MARWSILPTSSLSTSSEHSNCRRVSRRGLPGARPSRTRAKSPRRSSFRACGNVSGPLLLRSHRTFGPTVSLSPAPFYASRLTCALSFPRRPPPSRRDPHLREQHGRLLQLVLHEPRRWERRVDGGDAHAAGRRGPRSVRGDAVRGRARRARLHDQPLLARHWRIPALHSPVVV